MKKMKRQPTEWEKIFANGAVYKGLIPKGYQQLIQPSIKNKNMNTPSRKWAEDLKTFLQRRQVHGKMLNMAKYQRNANNNHNEVSLNAEWPSLKSPQIINAEEDIVKREPSYSGGENVNWCSHYGEEYGHSLN